MASTAQSTRASTARASAWWNPSGARRRCRRGRAPKGAAPPRGSGSCLQQCDGHAYVRTRAMGEHEEQGCTCMTKQQSSSNSARVLNGAPVLSTRMCILGVAPPRGSKHAYLHQFDAHVYVHKGKHKLCVVCTVLCSALLIDARFGVQFFPRHFLLNLYSLRS